MKTLRKPNGLGYPPRCNFTRLENGVQVTDREVCHLTGTPGLAIIEVNDAYSITHMQSGLRVIAFRSFTDAMKVADALYELFDWTLTQAELIPMLEQSVQKGWKLSQWLDNKGFSYMEKA